MANLEVSSRAICMLVTDPLDVVLVDVGVLGGCHLQVVEEVVVLVRPLVLLVDELQRGTDLPEGWMHVKLLSSWMASILHHRLQFGGK